MLQAVVNKELIILRHHLLSLVMRMHQKDVSVSLRKQHCTCFRILIAEIPPAIDGLVDWMEKSGVLAAVMSEDSAAALTTVDWQAKVAELLSVVATGVGGVAQMAASAVSATISVIAKFLIGLIFAIYILLGKETLAGQMNRLMEYFLKPSWN